MKYLKRFENINNLHSYNYSLFYKKLQIFFNEIRDKSHFVDAYYTEGLFDFNNYVSIRGLGKVILKISNGLVISNLDEVYPDLIPYLKSKLPFNEHIKNLIDIDYVKANMENINFSKEEYEYFKKTSRYNL
jgi:hypothetical protein